MPDMPDDAKITAHLPNLDIEIRYRDEGEAGEVMSIQMRAVPNADAVLRGLTAAMPWAMASANPFAFTPFSMNALAAVNPVTFWLQAAESVWRPWLAALPGFQGCESDRHN